MHERHLRVSLLREVPYRVVEKRPGDHAASEEKRSEIQRLRPLESRRKRRTRKRLDSRHREQNDPRQIHHEIDSTREQNTGVAEGFEMVGEEEMRHFVGEDGREVKGLSLGWFG